MNESDDGKRQAAFETITKLILLQLQRIKEATTLGEAKATNKELMSALI